MSPRQSGLPRKVTNGDSGLALTFGLSPPLCGAAQPARNPQNQTPGVTLAQRTYGLLPPRIRDLERSSDPSNSSVATAGRHAPGHLVRCFLVHPRAENLVPGWNRLVSSKRGHRRIPGILPGAPPLVGLPNAEVRDENTEFTTEGADRYCRHPLYFFVSLGLLSQQVITNSCVLLVGWCLLYFWIGSYFKERRMVQVLGEKYVRYQQTTNRFLPLPPSA